MDIQEYLKYSEHWLTNAPTRKDPIAIARAYAVIAQALAAERQADTLEKLCESLETMQDYMVDIEKAILRIADALESLNNNDNLQESVRIWGPK